MPGLAIKAGLGRLSVRDKNLSLNFQFSPLTSFVGSLPIKTVYKLQKKSLKINAYKK